MNNQALESSIAGESAPLRYYKVLMDGAPCHGGSSDFRWLLPKGGEPGGWVQVEGELEVCRWGLHLTTQPAVWYKPGSTVYLAEYRGEEPQSDEDKICVREARLVREERWDDHGVWTEGVHVVSEGVVTASGSAQVRAYGSAQVTASGSAQVTASGSAQVTASGSAQVTAYDSAQVRASDSAQVRASDSAQVTASGSAQVTASGSAQVRASGSAQVTASGSAQVRASGSAQVTAYDSAQVRASGSAQVTAYDSAQVQSTIYHSSSAVVALEHMAAHIDRRNGKLVLRGARGGELLVPAS